MRQASAGFYFKWVFYLPLAVLGIPVQVYVIVGLIDLLYQFWVHTRLIGRLGFLNGSSSPFKPSGTSQAGDYCIDRNWRNILSVGQAARHYADEREEEPIVYGIRKPTQLESGVGNLHYYKRS